MAACGLRDVPINDSEYNATEKILNLSLGIMSYI